MKKRHLSTALLGLLLIVFSACDSGPVNVSPAPADPFTKFSVVPDQDFGSIVELGWAYVCKMAPDDPSMSFKFTNSVTGPNATRGNFNPEVVLRDGECKFVYKAPTPNNDGFDEVTITEVVPDGWQVKHIDVYTAEQVNGNIELSTERVYGSSVTGLVRQDAKGFIAVFYNEPPSMGGEGCSPGSWKNRLLKIGAWPVDPDTPVGDVWNVPDDLADATLLEALSFKGGSSFNDKVSILLRAATAAYLNALTINYDLTPQQIIDGGNDAIASGDKSVVLDLAETLDMLNNQGCTLTDGDDDDDEDDEDEEDDEDDEDDDEEDDDDDEDDEDEDDE
jgi:hypothetical protein